MQERAFQVLKDAITADLQLPIYYPKAQTFVTVSASDVGLGAQLSQIQNGREVPIQFASHTLVPHERNFAEMERKPSVVFGPQSTGRSFGTSTHDKMVVLNLLIGT